MNSHNAHRIENRDLTLDDGTTLKWFKKNYKNFFGKTTIIYGRTRSGKSTIIDEIMYLCKDYIAGAFVICESAITIQSSPYYGKLPNKCIKSGITKEWLEEFMKMQKGRAAIYDTANEIKTLKHVFDRIKTPKNESLENTINADAERHLILVNNNNNLSYPAKKSTKEEIEKIKNGHLRTLYKTNIRKNKTSLENRNGISKEEICCIKYLDFNPNVMLIFDDCAASFKKWTKDSDDIKEIFYNGSHYYITQIISSQSDKEISSELRRNALVNIFTTQQEADANFKRSSNSFPKHEQKRAELCYKRLFSSTDVKTHQKLVYVQDTTINDPFFYTIADLYDEFKMGCEAIWKLDKRINEESGNEDTDNHFFNKYCD